MPKADWTKPYREERLWVKNIMSNKPRRAIAAILNTLGLLTRKQKQNYRKGK